MGNSSSVPDPPQGPLLSAPPMFDPGNVEPLKVEKDKVVNPGPYEQLHAQAREILPQPFEGATFTMNRALSNYFQISHNVVVSNNPKVSGYTFGSSYVGVKDGKANLVLTGNVSPSGNFSGRIMGMINDTTCKATFQEHEKILVTDFGVEHSGKDYTAGVTFTGINPVNQSGVAIFQYLQSWSKRLAVGAELMYQRHDNIPGKQLASFGLGGRYTGDDWTLAGTVHPLELRLKLSGCSKINQNLEMAAEVEGSLAEQQGLASIGYKYSLPESQTVFKGSVNTDLNVVATMEKEFQHLPCIFTLSAVADQMKNQYRWGIGLTLG